MKERLVLLFVFVDRLVFSSCFVGMKMKRMRMRGVLNLACFKRKCMRVSGDDDVVVVKMLVESM